MNTVNKISQHPNLEQNFFLLTSDFIMNFKKASISEKIEMFVEPPKQDLPRPEFRPYLAAMTHKLANDENLPIPSWVFDKNCYLPGDQPFFGSSAGGDLRTWFLYKSPGEFRHRNLFIDELELERV
jgi:hypothetical protein